MHYFARKGNENLCTLLPEHNADVNAQSEDGYTPLHLSAREGNKTLCRFLLEHNADANIQDKFGYTPLHWCVRKGNETLCRFLLEHNADANIQDKFGYTPLHWCAREGNGNLCRLLLKHNADVNIQDSDGYTPLHLSSFNRDYSREIINLLVEYGVQNINIRDAEGLTPLQIAVRRGNAEAVKMLVDLGSDVSVVKADETDAKHLEFLTMKEFELDLDFAQKANKTKYTTGVASVQGVEKFTEPHLKSEKIRRQPPWHAYTTKEIEEEPEAEQVKTLKPLHPEGQINE